MGKYKLQYWLPASFGLSFLLALQQVGISMAGVLTAKMYAISIFIWSLVFTVILSLAYRMAQKDTSTCKFIFLGAFLAALLLFYIDGEMRGHLFFDVYDAGNAIALLLYGALFFGLFSLVNRIDDFLIRAFRKVKA